MARVSDQKRAELESIWRAHHEGSQASDLNQQEYCELHGLPLKRFSNWRAQFKDEETVAKANLLWRRGGGLRHVSGHMANKEIEPVSTGYVPSAKSLPDGRRNFRMADKKRIVAEALAPGASISAVARRYGINRPLLYRWKRELVSPAPEPVFLPVTLSDALNSANALSPALLNPMSQPVVAPVLVERAPQEIEVELVGGRRVRFARDTDPGRCGRWWTCWNSERMMMLPSEVKVHIAVGYTDMRKGMDGLAMLVEKMPMQDPFSGQLFAFRGLRANLIKIMFGDGNGLCLFTKRLDQGSFVWPPVADRGGKVVLSSAQLSLLIEGIDWRAPERVWRPERAG